MNDDLPLPPHGHAPDNGNRMPCRRCNAPTLVSTLNHYGARCFECYERYCAEPQPSPDVGDKRLDPLGWAHALKRREEAGERLTLGQREMWRAALRYESSADAEPTAHQSRAGARFPEAVS